MEKPQEGMGSMDPKKEAFIENYLEILKGLVVELEQLPVVKAANKFEKLIEDSKGDISHSGIYSGLKGYGNIIKDCVSHPDVKLYNYAKAIVSDPEATERTRKDLLTTEEQEVMSRGIEREERPY